MATDDVDGALITFHLLRVRPHSSICTPGLLYLALRGAPEVRGAIDDVAVGATRAGFNTRLLEDLWIPLPPLAEQGRIEQLVQLGLSQIASLASGVKTAVNRGHAFDEAALAKAFRGELVPQDPTDEPASVLLDRIRAERAATDAPARRTRAAKLAPASAPPPVAEPPALDLVIAALQTGDARLSAAAIVAATGLDATAVRLALKELVAAGQVRTHGKARGTTYEWST